MVENKNISDTRPEFTAWVKGIDQHDVQTHVKRESARKEAADELGATYAEIVFLEGIEIARRSGELQATVEIGDYSHQTSVHPYLHGFRWWRDFLAIEPDTLVARNLLERPHVDGEPRHRLARRKFWGLTDEARDALGFKPVGKNERDLNEGVTHSVGTWAWVSFIEHHAAKQGTDVQTERYTSIDKAAGNTRYDIVTRRWERSTATWELDHVAEVETVIDSTHIAKDARELSKAPGGSTWIVPRQSDAKKLLEKMQERGLFRFKSKHETITTHGFQEINRRIRIARAKVTQPDEGGEYAPVSQVFGLHHLICERLEDENPNAVLGPEELSWGEMIAELV